MQFPFITYGMMLYKIYKRQYTVKTLTLRNCMCVRASRASELRIFFAFSHSKTAISFNILLVLQILCLRNIYCQVSYNICIHTQSMQFPFITYGMMLYKRQYTDKALTLRKCMYVRASRASDLRTFSNFHILKLLFPSIFCWYLRYFVSDTYLFSGVK